MKSRWRWINSTRNTPPIQCADVNPNIRCEDIQLFSIYPNPTRVTRPTFSTFVRYWQTSVLSKCPIIMFNQNFQSKCPIIMSNHNVVLWRALRLGAGSPGRRGGELFKRRGCWVSPILDTTWPSQTRQKVLELVDFLSSENSPLLQFFITLCPSPWLAGRFHPIGHLTRGFQVTKFSTFKWQYMTRGFQVTKFSTFK